MKIKRKSALLMAVALAFTLAACNSQSQQNKTNSTKTNTIKTNNNMTTTTASKTIHLTRADFLKKVANFEENPEKWVYLGDKPAIIAPILEELADEYDGQIYIYKVDTEAEQQLAAEFGIRSIPSLLFVPMGEAPQMAQGALPKDAFKQAIEEVLLKNS